MDPMMERVRELARLTQDADDEQRAFRLDQVSAVDFANYPPTLTVGNGDLARPMRFLGRLSDYHPGQTIAYLEMPGAPLVIGPVPVTGVGENYLSHDPIVGLDVLRFVGTAGEPAFGTGVSNYQDWIGTGDHAKAAFYKAPDGWVRLSGLVTDQAAALTAPQTLFTLPEGYRPPVAMHFTVYTSGDAGGTAAGGWVRVSAAGVVTWMSGGGLRWLSLANITFPTAWNRAAWPVPSYLSGWKYDITETDGGVVEFYLRDDGWVWTKGIVDGSAGTAGVGTRVLDPPPLARIKAYNQMIIGFGFGAATFQLDVAGTIISRGGVASQNVIGGNHWFSYVGEHINWTAPTLAGGWVNFLSNWERAGYYLDHMGVVHLRGLIKSGSTGVAALTLPAGLRPKHTHIFCVVASAPGSAVDQYGRVDVNENGDVVPVQAGDAGYLSLNNISFRAEQ